jgi:hypothetical protein
VNGETGLPPQGLADNEVADDLIEPPVDPAEPPTNISATIVSNASVVHVLKSAVANPVVVRTDTAWNTPVRTADVLPARSSVSRTRIRSADPATRSTAYSRSSWSRNAARGWRRSSVR